MCKTTLMITTESMYVRLEMGTGKIVLIKTAKPQI